MPEEMPAYGEAVPSYAYPMTSRRDPFADFARMRQLMDEVLTDEHRAGLGVDHVLVADQLSAPVIEDERLESRPGAAPGHGHGDEAHALRVVKTLNAEDSPFAVARRGPDVHERHHAP